MITVRVKLFAMLRDLAPPEADHGAFDLELREGTTPLQVVDQLKIPREMAHLLMIHGFHLLPKEVETRNLQPGDELAIFPPIAGG